MQLVTAITPRCILFLCHLEVASHPLYLQQIVEVLAVCKVRTYV
jgi:hypothetical protein